MGNNLVREQRHWLGLSIEMAATLCGIPRDRYVGIEAAAIVPSKAEEQHIRCVLFGPNPPQPIPAEMHDDLASLTEHDRAEVLRFQDFLSRCGRTPPARKGDKGD